jgi:hypothetical protein
MINRVHKRPKGPETATSLKNGHPISGPRRLCHILGLDSFYLLVQSIRGHPTVESQKVAVLENFGTACYVSLLHIIPTMASIILVTFNFKGYYIGGELSGPKGEDGLKLLGLQFTAKMLELWTVASLSCIIFALIRNQLLDGNIPFGAVTTGFEFSKISLFWSKEFIATCAGNFKSPLAKLLLVSTIAVFTILGATLGPAAAVTSQPSLRNWPAGGTTFYLNTTFDDIYPSRLDKASISQLPCSVTPNTPCFPPNHYLLAQELLSHWPNQESQAEDYDFPQVMPENILISGRRALRNLAVRFVGPFVYRPPLSVATVPLASIADAVAKTMNYWTMANRGRCAEGKQGFCFYNDIFFSVDAMQPVTFVACHPNEVGSTLRFPNVDPDEGGPLLVDLMNNALGSQEWFNDSTRNGAASGLDWIDLPAANFGRSSLGAIVSIPKANTSDAPDRVLACTVDARWANATAIGSFLKGPRIVSGFPADWFTTGRLRLTSKGQLLWPQVQITPAWAQNLNPTVEGLNMSVFTLLSNSVGGLSDISLVPDSANAVEGILAVMVADGMSRTGNLVTIQGSLKEGGENDWTDEILPRQVFGNGGSAFNYSLVEGHQFARFQLLVTVNGYGYGLATASLLSCLVLMVYSTIALVYVMHSTYFSTTSSAWESISEILALAMNSRSTAALHNTSAGIFSLNTLKESVSIGVDNGHLELVFHKDTMDRGVEKRNMGRVEANIPYS